MNERTMTEKDEYAAEIVRQVLTVNQVLDLRTEAGLAGDLAMVAICNDALKGDQAALSKCYTCTLKGQSASHAAPRLKRPTRRSD